MKPPPQGEWADGLFGARLFLIMSSGYFMSYGLRAVNATIAPELVEGTGLSNAELGSLTSAYFLAFAVLQLPLGVWLGRNGVERLLLIGPVLILLIVELLNSAIEATVDRVGLERHPLSGLAKDTGSAAVFLAITLLAASWLLVLIDR